MIKIKAKQNGKEIKVAFYNKKEFLTSVIKYENECMVCKKVSVDDADLGDNHICSECLSVLENQIKEASALKAETNKKTKKQDKGYWVKRNADKYVASIKIVNWIDYKNMLTLRVSQKIATMLVEMIIKGINTASKIAKELRTDKVVTIYTYLKAMNRVGMIYSNDDRKVGKYNRIYKINRSLNYTAI